jgi:hypothetical protein
MILLSGKVNRGRAALYSDGRRTYGGRGVIVKIGTVGGRAGRPFPKQGIKRASPWLRTDCDAAEKL